jgi:hypothetical protein
MRSVAVCAASVRAARAKLGVWFLALSGVGIPVGDMGCGAERRVLSIQAGVDKLSKYIYKV